MISEDRLDQYLGKRSAPKQPSNRQINMINGGAPIIDSSNRSIKNYVRAVRHPQMLSVIEGRHSKIRRIGWEPITFSDEEEKGILIDTGSSINVLFVDAFQSLRIEHQCLNKDITPLLSFSVDVVEQIISVQLPFVFGAVPKRTIVYTHFLVVDCPTAYNTIIGRPALTRMKAILHMLLLKFPTHAGICQVRGDQLSARMCYVSATRESARATRVARSFHRHHAERQGML